VFDIYVLEEVCYISKTDVGKTKIKQLLGLYRPILLHIALDTDGPFSTPRSRLQGISSFYDVFIYDNLWLILQCANSVETVTPEDQGPRISCQLSFSYSCCDVNVTSKINYLFGTHA
jgi:hypothetical protein